MSKKNALLNRGVRGKKLLSMIGIKLDSSCITKSNSRSSTSDSVDFHDSPFSQECKYLPTYPSYNFRLLRLTKLYLYLILFTFPFSDQKLQSNCQL